jgi:hypothetical protein
LADTQALTTTPWRLRRHIQLTWHDWPDEGSVVFEQRSGQLVELDLLGGAVMACIEGGAISVDAMAEALATDLGQTADDAFRVAIGEIVEQFHHLGWVDPIMNG